MISIIVQNKKYYTFNVLLMPTEVVVTDIDIENQKARIEHNGIDVGLIEFSRLYETEEDCPCR